LKRRVRIGAGAQADMVDASRWYDAQQSGLGLDFLRSIGRVIARIEAAPRMGSPVPGVSDADIRRVLVRRFPYHVVYIELPDRAQILAVAHHRRRPRYWIGRIPR
jgi:plasmid stabilization system protein ParE